MNLKIDKVVLISFLFIELIGTVCKGIQGATRQVRRELVAEFKFKN